MAGDKNTLDLLRTSIELAMPDLRHYYRLVRKARVVAVYPVTAGCYYADVQPLRNDESVDPDEPIIPKVEIPVIWAGPDRGVVCPPCKGVLCDLAYYDGDPNYPRISNFRWQGMNAPAASLNEFVIQLEKGVEIRIDKQKQIVQLTPSNWKVEIGGNARIQAKGTIHAKAAGQVVIDSSQSLTLQAPQIIFKGKLTHTGLNGEPALSELSGTFRVRQGDVSAEGVSLRQHVHKGVKSGGGLSGIPVPADGDGIQEGRM